MMLEKGHKGGKSKRWNRRWVETDWCSEAKLVCKVSRVLFVETLRLKGGECVSDRRSVEKPCTFLFLLFYFSLPFLSPLFSHQGEFGG